MSFLGLRRLEPSVQRVMTFGSVTIGIHTGLLSLRPPIESDCSALCAVVSPSPCKSHM